MNSLRKAWHKPHGLGLYLRAPGGYPGRDPGAYAERAGATWVAPVHEAYSDAQLVELRRRGLRVWLFDMPHLWLPTNARQTFDAFLARVERLGLHGVVVDAERAQSWASYGEAYARDFARYVARRSNEAGVPVLWTTVPAWPYWRAVADETRGAMVWGSPQIYGVREDTALRTPADRARWLATWRGVWGHGRVVPSLAAWGRSVQEQAAYLAEFDEPAAILWDTPESRLPAATLRAMAAHIGGGMSPRTAMVGLPLALVGAAMLAKGMT